MNTTAKLLVPLRILVGVVFLTTTGHGAAESDTQRVERQQTEQRELLREYEKQLETAQENIAEVESQLAEQQADRREFERSQLREPTMKMAEIRGFLRNFDGDIKSAVNKILHSELKQTRDDAPDDKMRTVKPFSAPSTDISGLETGSQAAAPTGEDTSGAITTSGDHAAIMRELSPAMKLEFAQELKARYETALLRAQVEYERGLQTLATTDEHREFTEAERASEAALKAARTQLKVAARNIERQKLRLEGLEERYAEAAEVEKKTANSQAGGAAPSPIPPTPATVAGSGGSNPSAATPADSRAKADALWQQALQLEASAFAMNPLAVKQRQTVLERAEAVAHASLKLQPHPARSSYLSQRRDIWSKRIISDALAARSKNR